MSLIEFCSNFVELENPCDTCLINSVCSKACEKFQHYCNNIDSYRYRCDLAAHKEKEKRDAEFLRAHMENSPSIFKMFGMRY